MDDVSRKEGMKQKRPTHGGQVMEGEQMPYLKGCTEHDKWQWRELMKKCPKLEHCFGEIIYGMW
jgi:hypothetical protein